jgi:transcriptional regulator
MSETRAPLIRGTLNALILKSVSWGELHGYAIARWIQRYTADVLRVDEGVLYPALHRLERDGLLGADWGRNDTGRRAKFYSLTERGRERLEAEVARWHRSSQAVTSILDAEEA